MATFKAKQGNKIKLLNDVGKFGKQLETYVKGDVLIAFVEDDFQHVRASFSPNGYPDGSYTLLSEYEYELVEKFKVEDECIQKYLPDGHIDKVSVIKELPKHVEYNNTVFELYKPNESLVGRWIKALTTGVNGSRTKKGEYYKILEDDLNDLILDIPIAPYISKSNISEFELMPIGWGPNKTETLEKTKLNIPTLEEAEKRFPIGTKFTNTNLYSESIDDIVVQTKPFYDYSNGERINIKYGYKGLFTIWKDGIWAIKQELKPLDLSNTKIWIGDNPELSRKVQEKAFELGWGWNKHDKSVQYTDKYSLHFWDDKEICYSTDLTKDYFLGRYKKEIFPSDLGINVKLDQDAICDHCKDTFYDGSVNTGPHNLCEGRHCKEATESYLEDNPIITGTAGEMDVQGLEVIYHAEPIRDKYIVGIDPFRLEKVEEFTLSSKINKINKFDEQQFLSKDYNKEFKLNIKQQSKTQLKLKL